MSEVINRITKRMIANSHRAQSNGVDYQQAAYDVADGLSFEPTDEEIGLLESSPDLGCDCPFCSSVRNDYESTP